MATFRPTRGNGRSRRAGQALVETGIVVVMLSLLMMGIVELGWTFMRTSMIMHAARDGARYGATLNDSSGTYRDTTTGCFTGTALTKITTRISDQLQQVGFSASGTDVCQGCDGAIPITRVTISGELPMISGIFGSSFEVNRAVTFEDEARQCPANQCGGCS